MTQKLCIPRFPGSARCLVTWTALALVGSPVAGLAQDWSVKLEPGVAVPLSAPQSDVFNVGGAGSVEALLGLTPFIDVGPSASFVMLPPASSQTQSGTVWALGAGGRVKRPHDAESLYGASPWAGADLLYVRTGDLNRPGFDVAAGVSIPVDASRSFWVGPFVRYLQVLQSNRLGYDNRDAKLLILGISLEMGSTPERKHSEGASEPDRDHDGVPDSTDRCPDVTGTAENFGCPNYRRLIVQKDKLELKEKLYFAWNQATLEEASLPVLDEVAQALKDNPSFRVMVEGHSDSTGAEDHNQTLSEKRAETVLQYLTAHGVVRDRLTSKGFSSSMPLDTNATAAGRENNRRVEFVVHFKILNDGSAK